MKTFNSILKTLILFLFVGMLFFSCPLNDNDGYGTLVIKLPGSGSARAAVSGTFKDTLSYKVICEGPDNVESEFSAGGTVSIPLNAGRWTVTVEVLNAASENIGQGTKEVDIETGKSVTVTMPISIDTSGNRITEFAITSPVPSLRSNIEDIGENKGIITVYLLNGTALIIGSKNISIDFIHTGVSVELPEEDSLSLASLNSSVITVTAENNKTRTYDVLLEEVEPPPPGYTSGWPSNSILAEYGISGMDSKQLGFNFSYNNVSTSQFELLTIKFYTLNATSKFLSDWFSENGWDDGGGNPDEYGWGNTATGVGVNFTRIDNQATLVLSKKK